MSTAKEIADHIQEQVETGLAPAGGLIGTEAELRAVHSVSIATLRRAVRILEQRQVAVMRRGVNGGLYANEPSVDATANYVTAQWERSGAARETIMRDAAALRALVLRRASERMSVAEAAAVAAFHAQSRAADDPIKTSVLAVKREHLIGKLTRNPVIELGHAVTMCYQRNIFPFEVLALDDPAFSARANKLVDEKISGLIRGDVEAAIEATNEYVAAYLDRLEVAGPQSLQPHLSRGPAHATSLPMFVCRAVLREIRKRNWNTGEFLGQEAELMARYKVSRTTWRQAVSILSEYSAIESRRGGSGGLYIAPFNSATATENASTWLARQRATPADGLELIAAIAPHHAAKAFANAPRGKKADASKPQQVDCGLLIEQVLDQETSPLLTLAALAVPRAMLCTSAPVELGCFDNAQTERDMIERAVLNHVTALA